MGNRFASGRFSIAECDRCGQRTELKKLVIKTKQVSIKVCQTCWEPDQPQLQLGMYPVDDPQAIREPRRDNSYIQSGYSGLQISANTSTTVLSDGTPSGGSRVIQWGWNPVGGARANDLGLTPNYLIASTTVANVTIN